MNEVFWIVFDSVMIPLAIATIGFVIYSIHDKYGS